HGVDGPTHRRWAFSRGEPRHVGYARSPGIVEAEQLVGVAVPGIDLIGPIARGGQAVVYRARRAGQDFAVKVPPLDHRDPVAKLDEHHVAVRFRREAGILARVRHAGLPAIMEVGSAGATPYMVMEYVEGQTLSSVLAQGPMPESAVVDVGKQLADALAAVH